MNSNDINHDTVETPLLINTKGMESQQFTKLQSGDHEDLQTRVQENYKILFFTAATFLIFVIAEIIGALASGSLSLLGDAGAMSVDVFTYICNYYAERIKLREGILSNKVKWVLEVYIPSFSVLCLFSVTGYVMNESIQEIRFPSNDDSVNVFFLYGFASFNLVIDIASGYMFLRKGKKFAYTEQLEQESVGNVVTDGIIENGTTIANMNNTKTDQPTLVLQKTLNINMLAAFSHLGADSLRTASIFLAAIVASATDIDSGLCDAWAAIIVSTTIFVMAVPLINCIIKSALKLYRQSQEV